MFGCYSAVRLGPRLPIACRKLGHRLGMTYNYLRLLVKMLAPEEETALKVLSLYNKSNQQMNALSRELSENMFQVKKSFTDTLPEELKRSPFENLSLENMKNSLDVSDPLQVKAESSLPSSGSELLYQGILEKRRILEKKARQEEIEALSKLT